MGKCDNSSALQPPGASRRRNAGQGNSRHPYPLHDSRCGHVLGPPQKVVAPCIPRHPRDGEGTYTVYINLIAPGQPLTRIGPASIADRPDRSRRSDERKDSRVVFQICTCHCDSGDRTREYHPILLLKKATHGIHAGERANLKHDRYMILWAMLRPSSPVPW